MWPFKSRAVRTAAPVYRVVDRSWRHRLRLLVVGAVACGALVNLGWQLGRLSAAEALATNERLQDQLDAQQDMLEGARERLGELTISGAARVGARELALQDFQRLSRRIAELENELRYYRAVMPEADHEAPLRISSFETLDGRSGETRVAVLLTQNLRATEMVSGRVDMRFHGFEDGEPVAHALDQVLAAGEYPVPFEFRYFQALPMSILLPGGFEPESVVVQAHLGRTIIEREFPWTLSEVGDSSLDGANGGATLGGN